jgi:hypothetical protein
MDTTVYKKKGMKTMKTIKTIKTMKKMKNRVVPYRIRKTYKNDCYTVSRKTRANKNKVFSKCTTKINAVKQDKLLRALLYNPKFVVNP